MIYLADSRVHLLSDLPPRVRRADATPQGAPTGHLAVPLSPSGTPRALALGTTAARGLPLAPRPSAVACTRRAHVCVPGGLGLGAHTLGGERARASFVWCARRASWRRLRRARSRRAVLRRNANSPTRPSRTRTPVTTSLGTDPQAARAQFWFRLCVAFFWRRPPSSVRPETCCLWRRGAGERATGCAAAQSASGGQAHVGRRGNDGLAARRWAGLAVWVGHARPRQQTGLGGPIVDGASMWRPWSPRRTWNSVVASSTEVTASE
ncbi:hypothetical protein PHLGIDRAFT_269805 [Phlebiopsis gigantea 11061_1 CR5-6]|uniref:Uncharacterized protein n=1 Tax=Phlebiopsis gigantea (strain 11061_1 CR5-6) TaxID=745531 RepID=A0A0C3S177_PHLG1|nr:hypothetical protein PHLGIDRAFT_269805 [Phlebiopsis gigantea 11061_1 CR5-6]